MRYINLEGYTQGFMDVGGYKHNYESFYKKIIYQMFINRGRKNHNSRCRCNTCGYYLISSLSLLVKNLKSDHGILLEVRHLKKFEKSYNESYKDGFKSIFDVIVICSWCLGV